MPTASPVKIAVKMWTNVCPTRAETERFAKTGQAFLYASVSLATKAIFVIKTPTIVSTRFVIMAEFALTALERQLVAALTGGRAVIVRCQDRVVVRGRIWAVRITDFARFQQSADLRRAFVRPVLQDLIARWRLTSVPVRRVRPGLIAKMNLVKCESEKFFKIIEIFIC